MINDVFFISTQHVSNLSCKRRMLSGYVFQYSNYSVIPNLAKLLKTFHFNIIDALPEAHTKDLRASFASVFDSIICVEAIKFTKICFS
jgi:hypothetical protein